MQIKKLMPFIHRTFHWKAYTRIAERYLLLADRQARRTRYCNCRIEELLNYELPPVKIKGIMHRNKADQAKKLTLVN